MSELWQRLRDAELVSGEPPVSDTPHWSSRLLLGVSGWLAALFLLFFLFLAFESLIRSSSGALLLGAGLLALARAMMLAKVQRDLLAQCVLVLVLAGDGWLLYGLLDSIDTDSPWLWVGLAALSLTIALLFAHWLLRLFHGFAAGLLLTVALDILGLHGLCEPLLLLAVLSLSCAMARWPRHSALHESLQLGLALALLALAQLPSQFWEIAPWQSLAPAYLPHWPTAPLSLLILLVFTFRCRLPWLPALPLLAASALLPGFAAGCLLLLLGFRDGQRGLWTLGLLLLLSAGALYYYDLHLTLMTKAGLLALCGALLLLVRQLTLVRSPA